MVGKLIFQIKKHFGCIEAALHTIILFFIPLITLFSVMSDRNPYNYINIGLYVVEIILMLLYVWKYKKFRFDILSFCIVLFNLSILISQILNKRISEFPSTILLLSIFSIIFYQFVCNETNKEYIYKLILIGGLLFAAYFIFTYFINPSSRMDILSVKFGDRLGNDFSDQNDLAKYLAIFGILSLIDVFKRKKWIKVFPFLSFLLFTFLVLITGSVSNLLCLLLVSLLVLVFCSKRKNRLIVLICVLSSAALIYGLLQLPFMNYFKIRIDGIFNAFFDPAEQVDGSAADRIKLFLEGFRLFLTRPLFGFGYDQVQFYTHGNGLFSHSNVIELLASFGILGFVAFETLIVYPLYYAFKNDYYRKNALFTLLYLFIFQFFLIIFRKKIEFMLIPLGFSCIVRDDSRSIIISFEAFKPNFIAKKPFIYKTKPSILAIGFEKDEAFIKPINESFSSEDFNIKFCAIVEKRNESQKNDFIIEFKKCGWLLERQLSDVLDEVNPQYVITSVPEIRLVKKASFGKNLKVLCFINDKQLMNTKIKGRKIYKIFKSTNENTTNFKQDKTEDKHIVYMNKFEDTNELQNLINILKT